MKWLLNIFRRAVREEMAEIYKQLEKDIHEIHHGIFELNDDIEELFQYPNRFEILDKNVKKVNEMLLELKGVVSLSRACLSERKQIDLEIDKCVGELKRAIKAEFDENSNHFFIIRNIKSQLDDINKKLTKSPVKKKSV